MLETRIGVLAQFEVRGEEMVPTEHTPNLDPGKGIRRSGGILQLGLTEFEIERLHGRIRQLIEWVDEGKYELF